jgi:hypothetical protein
MAKRKTNSGREAKGKPKHIKRETNAERAAREFEHCKEPQIRAPGTLNPKTGKPSLVEAETVGALLETLPRTWSLGVGKVTDAPLVTTTHFPYIKVQIITLSHNGVPGQKKKSKTFWSATRPCKSARVTVSLCS